MIGVWVRGAWAAVALTAMASAAARAEDGLWIQIEAKRDQPAAEARAAEWRAAFPDLSGFRLPSGWVGIALGPYPPETAGAELAALKAAGRIPADSYIVEGSAYRERLWGWDATAAPVTSVAPTPLPPRPETPAEARRAEAALTREERAELQSALAFAGHPAGAADGAFGPATRTAIAAWQAAQGEPATGALTTPQRATLLAPWRAAIAALGLTPVTDGPAGIAATLPLALLEPPRYAPPFVHYAPKGGSGVRLTLISSPLPSDQGMVAGMLPGLLPGAEVTLAPDRLTARRGGAEPGEALVETRDGLVKGWILTWPAATPITPALEALRTSWRPIPGRALDPTHGAQTEAERQALRQGLEVHRPTRSRSGVALPEGHAATTQEAVAGCRAVTVDGRPAEVIAQDAARGLAILRTDLTTPRAAFAERTEAGEVIVSGYSTGPSMAAPAQSRARTAAADGGRIALSARLFPGDGGGPVLDKAGRVAGIVLAGEKGAPPVALSAPALRDAITAAGIASPPLGEATPLPPARLTAAARAATLRILCWD